MEKDLHETNQYQDAAFPAQMYTTTRAGIVPRGRGFLDLHWHEEIQFTLVVSGCMTMQANGESFKLQQGEAIFLNRNVLHMSSALSDDGCYVSFNYPEKMLGFFSGSRMEQDGVLPYTGDASLQTVIFRQGTAWQEEILSILWEMKDCFDRISAGLINVNHPEYRIALLACQLWYDLIAHLDVEESGPRTGVRKQDRIRTMMSYVHENYANEVTLADIAGSANVSEGECCRCFKTMAGEAPIQYLNTYRVIRAMELLSTTELPITEVAARVGFGDAGYFARCFKKRTRMTPTAYRKG